jgi:hypothetical protein
MGTKVGRSFYQSILAVAQVGIAQQKHEEKYAILNEKWIL